VVAPGIEPGTSGSVARNTTFRIYSDVVFWVVTPCGLRSWIPTFRRNMPTYLVLKCIGWRLDFFGRIQGRWPRRTTRGERRWRQRVFSETSVSVSVTPFHLIEMKFQSIYWAGRRRCCGPSPQQGQEQFCTHPDPYPVGAGGSFRGVQRPWRGADYSPPPCAEVKNTWSSTSVSIPPIHIHDVMLN
jgi:hypothetical protein